MGKRTVSVATLVAELDSIEALLQLLLQKSLAAGDAAAFAAELDDALSQAEADEQQVTHVGAIVVDQGENRRRRDELPQGDFLAFFAAFGFLIRLVGLIFASFARLRPRIFAAPLSP